MIVDNFIRLDYDELSKREWKALFKALTFVNDNMDIVQCYREVISRGYVQLPRGAWFLLPNHVRYEDRRSCPSGKTFDFKVKLDDVEKDERFEGQTRAVESMMTEQQGIVIRPPGTGKTQIALAFAASVGTPTLVLVHTEDILQQWIEYAKKAIPGAKIGVIRGQQVEIGDITIATVQTMRRFIMQKPKKWWAQWGAVIQDEAHHVSAATFEAVMNCFPAKYRFGFTASPTRADGMHPTMKFILGPIIHKQAFSSPVDLKVVRVRTKFYYGYRGRFDWMPMLNRLVTDKARNKQIAKVVKREIDSGNSILVLSRRIEHLELISGLVGNGSEILTAKRSRQDRKRILAGLRDGSIRCVLATQLADEALDVQRLNRVLLVHPGKHEGRIIQQIGRAIRKHEEKRDAVIYDFVDWKVSVLRRQWNQRRHTYKKNGISIKKGRSLWR